MIARKHILLVEDNPDDFEATSRSLKQNNFTNSIQWCKNGEDALDYLHHKGIYAHDRDIRTPDLVLLDLNMAGIDGRRVLEIVKTQEALKSIPIVILTTSADRRDVDQCYALGANTYIQKPVNFDGLTRAIGALKGYWFDTAILPAQKA